MIIKQSSSLQSGLYFLLSTSYYWNAVITRYIFLPSAAFPAIFNNPRVPNRSFMICL